MPHSYTNHTRSGPVLTKALRREDGRGPRSLALPDWESLCRLAAALVERSVDHFAGWGGGDGYLRIFAACTAARIGEVSGARRADIDQAAWTWTVRRQTAPGPGRLIDKGTKGKRARSVPLIADVRPLVARRLAAIEHDPMARLFTGPAGGRPAPRQAQMAVSRMTTALTPDPRRPAEHVPEPARGQLPSY